MAIESTGAEGDPLVLFADAYRAHAASVRGYLLARGIDDPDAVCHDVYLDAHARLPTLVGGADGLRTLLFSIAHARVVDAHRRRTSRPGHTEYDPEADPRQHPSAEDEFVGRADPALSMLRGLSDDQREVLSLRIIADLSLEQTAEIMNRSIGAVKQLQLRALERLRTDLATGTGVDA